MISGFDFLGFQAIKHFPTKNRIFLLAIQCTITNNSFLLVFHTRMLLVYVFRMYSYVARMCPYVLVCYSYVLVCYSYVLVWCFSHDQTYYEEFTCYKAKGNFLIIRALIIIDACRVTRLAGTEIPM